MTFSLYLATMVQKQHTGVTIIGIIRMVHYIVC
nr:MAG TPA: hypothetical protein [Caudoviricetes sp.]